MPLPKPAITGTDFAGVVEAVGPRAGIVQTGGSRMEQQSGVCSVGQGTCAEFVWARSKVGVSMTPGNVTDEVAAAGWRLVGITAHMGLFHRARN